MNILIKQLPHFQLTVTTPGAEKVIMQSNYNYLHLNTSNRQVYKQVVNFVVCKYCYSNKYTSTTAVKMILKTNKKLPAEECCICPESGNFKIQLLF